MENKNSVVLVLGVILVLVLGYGALNISKIANNLSVEKLSQNLQRIGAVSGPSISGPSFSVNGAEEMSFSSAFNTASSTLCSFRVSATSTLELASLKIDTATNTALILEIGKSVLMDATTTKIGSTITNDSNAKNTIVASTSPGIAGNSLTFSPLDYLVMKYGGGFGKTDLHLMKGTCKAKFLVN